MEKACFLGKQKKVIPFVPEIEVEEVSVTKEKYTKYFPEKENLEYTNLKLSNIGEYSIARPHIAAKIADSVLEDVGSSSTVTDAFGNMGGMTIALAQRFSKVNTCEIVPTHCEILQNNLEQYGLLEKVTIKCEDYMNVMKTLNQDAIILDPPWGGTDYKNKKYIDLGLNNVNIVCIINKLLTKAKYIYMMVPHNYKYEDLRLIDANCDIVMKKLEPERKQNSKMLLRFSKAKTGGMRNNKTRRHRK
jgi:tRNA/tmRNA/rRNA uracil-C5-methylase (TrmA/RlmC/RlmD family)